MVKDAQALADEEEQYKLHRLYKRELLAIVGIPFTGAPQAIPQTLTAMQTARLVMPDCEKTQKIIAQCIIVKYGHRAIWNDDDVSDFLNELAIELKITLPDIAHWWLNGARPRYTICSQLKIIGNNSESSNQAATEPENIKDIQDNTKPKSRELTAWLLETWIKEGKPGGTIFFTRLKKYVDQKGSPITAYYNAGGEAGFKWKTSKGTSGETKKSTLLNKVSKFKKMPQ